MHRSLALLLGLAALAGSSPASAREDELAAARAAYAASFTHPEVHLRLARLHRERGHGILAFDLTESLRRQSPLAFRAAFAEVFLVDPIEANEASIASMLAVLESDPTGAEPASRLGRAYQKRGELDRAGELFTMASQREPDERRHLERIAGVLNLQENHGAAVRLLEKWDAEHPASAFAAVGAVQEALDAGDLQRAKRLVKAGLDAHPGECELYCQRGEVYSAEGKAREAERFLVRAVQLCPDRPRLHAALARFALLVLRDPVRALDHYLDTYFLDPNHDDGEYVDKRIRALSDSLAESLVRSRVGDCRRPDCLAALLGDENPAVVRLALGAAEEAWDAELERPSIALLGHDDPDLRAGAMLLLARHGGDEFGLRLDALLASTDPRRLGMAAQLAVRLRGRSGRAAATQLLGHPDELVRFDALTALGLEGGPAGRLAVSEHAANEPVPALRLLARRLGEQGS